MIVRARDELGLDHLTIPVITGPQARFRGTDLDQPHRSFATAGGWHYLPDAKRYAAGLQPVRADWVTKRDVLREVAERASALGLALYFRIDLRSVPALLEKYPPLRMVDAWSDPQPILGACVLNAELRGLLEVVLEDLDRYSPAGVLLDSWAVDLDAPSDVYRPTPPGLQQCSLLYVCFCTACRQCAARADVDAELAARRVRSLMADVLARPADRETRQAATSDPLVNAYVAARRVENDTWLARVAARETEREHALFWPAGQYPAHAPPPGWSHVGVGWCTVESDGEVLSALGPPTCPGTIVPAWGPYWEHATELVQAVKATVDRGVQFLDFEGIPEAAAEVYTWVRQAVRFARRLAGE
jgi:hypothetical protein